MLLLRFKNLTPMTRRVASTAAATTKSSDNPESPSQPSDIAPPRRKYRDEVSVLRALSRCVNPHLGLPAYGCAMEPWLGPGGVRDRTNRMAKAAGRNAARYVARTLLANDLTALVTEVPRIDCLVPLQTGESIRKELTDGAISEQEAMDRLLLLLAPRDAWALYKDATGVKWDSDTLHRLLDLQCATNSGFGGPEFFEHLPFVDRGFLPEPEELFYAAENRVFNALRNSRINPVEKSPIPVTNLANTETEDSSGIKQEDEEVLEASEAQLEKVELGDKEPVEEEILSAEPSSWHKGCPAEQLWTLHSDVLRTPAAYTAMIRGAAQFGAADRAWELAKEASNSAHKLPLCVYNDLLRCAHDCSSDEKGDIWARLLQGFELLRASKLRPDALTFSSALHSLHKSNLKSISNENGPPQNNADKALGLLAEARRLGIQPTLGLYANLLRALVTCRVSKFGQAYRLTEILADVLADVEVHWDCLSRSDILAKDDYEFGSTAMFCATVDVSNASSIRLVQRVYDLIHTRCGDRRFLLRNSVDSRNFYARYLLTKVLHGADRVTELSELYHNHRQIFQGNQKIYEALTHRLKAAVSRWKDALAKVNSEKERIEETKLESLESEASKAFEVLGEMLFDFVAMSTRMPPRLPSQISDVLMIFSLVDPWVEVPAILHTGRGVLREISEAGSRSAHKVAMAFNELIRSQEVRQASASSSSLPPSSPLSTAELTALVRMALHPTAYNLGDAEGHQTVAQREANDRALKCASDLLMLSQDAMIGERLRTSDVAAMEMLRSCWFTGSGAVTEYVWSLLEYLASIKYVSGRCAQHAFVEDGSLWRVLDAAEASLVPEGRTRSEVKISANSPRVQVISAVRRKFKEHVASNTPDK
ncbi:hypothetical protein Aperf_G00000093033 [Anoplocephala perfoliata]